MPASSDSALQLAGQLRQLSDEQLAALLGAREVRESGIRDFFDLAEALLDPDSIQKALARLDRSMLATLAAHGTDPELTRLALVTERGVPEPVLAQLNLWPALGLPSPDQLLSDSAPAVLAALSQVDPHFIDRVAAEHAFGTTTAVSELLSELQHESARELARGGVALPDSKRLAAAMNVDLDRVPSLLEIAARAGLAALDSGRWMPTGSNWVSAGSGERWALLAGGWLERLPPDIREILASRAHGTWGAGLDEYVTWLFPAGGTWMHERVQVYTRDAELLGITAHHEPSTSGVLLLTSGSAAAAPAMAELFPPEVSQVYLQHDLSVVSPGPLRPELDARLRAMADVEGRALASTYRISTPSIYRAMAMGETSATIRSFLTELSLTGIPQPLDYLLAEAAQRHGLVRVGALESGRSYISSSDATLLRTLLVDQSLASLGLTRSRLAPSGSASAAAASNTFQLESRFDQDVTFWSLSEARYPVAAEDGSGNVITLVRRRPTRALDAKPSASALGLVQKLRLTPSDPELTGAAWLSRQLDVAIKTKSAVTVTVQLPNGSSIDYQLEPTSVAGGRLRARDRRADIERTLPLSSITAVAPPA
jgi:hypothetical protein